MSQEALPYRGEVARAMALLPVSSASTRAQYAARLTRVASSAGRAAVQQQVDDTLVGCAIPSIAVYISRTLAEATEGRRLLDTLARRCMAIAPARNPHLRKAFVSALETDRALQLEIACDQQGLSPIRRFLHSNIADRPATASLADVLSLVESLEAPHVDIEVCEPVSRVERSNGGESMRKSQYKMSEIDALFFEAIETDSELAQRVWTRDDLHRQSLQTTTDASRSVDVGQSELYLESMLTRLASGGGLATHIADAVAKSDVTAEYVAKLPNGLGALRALIDAPPDEAVGDVGRLAFFHTECARAIANVAAGCTDIQNVAWQAADLGLIAILSEWTYSSRAHGHLQAEARRALANLQEALVLPVLAQHIFETTCTTASDSVAQALSQRVRYSNGVLPLQAARLEDTIARRLHKRRALVDVVFVHGLDGSPLLTWRVHSAQNGHARSAEVPRPQLGSETEVWARDWLSADLADARLLSVGHDAGVLRGLRQRGVGASMRERGRWLRDALAEARVGENSVVFVAHSYGGLLVKEVLLRDDDVWNRTGGVIFFATPHAGSFAASAGAGASLLFSQAVRELRREDGELRGLHEEFLAAVRARESETRALEVFSFAEGVGLVGRGGLKVGTLVQVDSATCGVGGLMVMERADHIGVCKVGERSDVRYKTVVDVVRRVGMRACWEGRVG